MPVNSARSLSEAQGGLRRGVRGGWQEERKAHNFSLDLPHTDDLASVVGEFPLGQKRLMDFNRTGRIVGHIVEVTDLVFRSTPGLRPIRKLTCYQRSDLPWRRSVYIYYGWMVGLYPPIQFPRSVITANGFPAAVERAR